MPNNELLEKKKKTRQAYVKDFRKLFVFLEWILRHIEASSLIKVPLTLFSIFFKNMPKSCRVHLGLKQQGYTARQQQADSKLA